MRTLKIGLLVPEQGAAGLWAASAQACAELAASEINMAGGLFGREVALRFIDAGTSALSAKEAAEDAIDLDEVEAIIGMFPSYARAAVARTVAGRVPFFYTPQFEGFETGADIVTTGETSAELMAPALSWLMQEKQIRRFFLCGSDYLWPRVSLRLARQLIGEMGGLVVGERYTSLDQQDYGALLEEIDGADADVVLPHFLGMEAIHFNRGFAKAGLSARTRRFASAVDETVVYGLGASATENMILCSSYFSTMATLNNQSFLERYHARYGANPPPSNAYGQSCYEGLHGLAALAEKAGALHTGRMRRALGATRQRRSARGSELMPMVGARHPIHLAEVDGYDIRLVHNLT